jgi:hypothetical protein
MAGRGVPFVPEGLSAWELGTNADIKAKAEEDFKKRSDDALGLPQMETTFVFVTSRWWPGKSDWAAAKSGQGIWKRVLAFDCEDLTQWMESAPAVASWFGEMIGKVPAQARSLQAEQEDYCRATKPALHFQCLLVGRDKNAGSSSNGWTVPWAL